MSDTGNIVLTPGDQYLDRKIEKLGDKVEKVGNKVAVITGSISAVGFALTNWDTIEKLFR